jgi:hypothetical protein
VTYWPHACNALIYYRHAGPSPPVLCPEDAYSLADIPLEVTLKMEAPSVPKLETTSWHAKDVDAVLQQLDTNKDGLTKDDVQRRLEQYGPNRLPEAEKESPWMRLLRQFHDVLIYILILAAIVTAFLGEWIDTGVILAVVVINAAIGYVQEGKAEAALDAIRGMLSLKAVVLRDGSENASAQTIWCRATSFCLNPATAFRRICACSRPRTCTSKRQCLRGSLSPCRRRSLR